MWRYSDYLTITDDFVPVFTESSDDARRWKSFIPHESMRRVLDQMLKALDRASPEEKRSLWMQGAYGTGKTHAAFVLKHILEDDPEEVRAYFEHPHYERINYLWRKLQGLRERGPFLVTYLSSSGHIDSTLKLLLDFQEGVRGAVMRQGLQTPFNRGLYDAILQRLDPQSTFNWPKAFAKHREKFLPYPSPDAVLEQLRDERDNILAEHVAQVLHAEGVVLMERPQQVIEWCEEVITTNGIASIVVIWDEFTDFFHINRAVSGLQELAQATFKIPLYLMLITHRSIEQFSQVNQDSQSVLKERFHMLRFEMETVTAYELLANTLQPKLNDNGQWQEKRAALWSEVRDAAAAVFEADVTLQDFERLTPIHPYTAFYLSTVSSQFSSSQRSLFKFIAGEGEHAFHTFLKREQSEQDSWPWLTPDYLWDYFFLADKDNTELREHAQSVLSVWNRHAEDLPPEAPKTRLFKTILLLIALADRMHRDNRLVRPLRSHLRSIYRCMLEVERIDALLDELVAAGWINAANEGADVEYSIHRHDMNQQRLAEIMENLERTLPFKEAVRSKQGFDPALDKLITLSGAAAVRLCALRLSAAELRERGPGVKPTPHPYQLCCLMLFCQTDMEIESAIQKLQEISAADATCTGLISHAPCGERRWGQWLEALARKQYCEEIDDRQNAKSYEDKGQTVIEEWVRELRVSKCTFVTNNEAVDIASPQYFVESFGAAVRRRFPHGQEQIDSTQTLHRTRNFGPADAKVGLGIGNPTNMHRGLINAFDSFEDLPANHPLKVMKALVVQTFKASPVVVLADLWKKLIREPYGLFPSPAGIAILGFLLREYCEGYYYFDGLQCHPLNKDTLAAKLHQVLYGREEECSIRSLTTDEELFCQHVREVFDLEQGRSTYPQQTRTYLRHAVQNLTAPLFILAWHETATPPAQEVLRNLSAFLIVDSDADDPELQQRIKERLDSGQLRDELKDLLHNTRMEEALWTYLKAQDAPFAAKLQADGLKAPEAIAALRPFMEGDVWLWDDSGLAQGLRAFKADRALIAALRVFLDSRDKELTTLLGDLQAYWERLPPPFFVFAETVPEELRLMLERLSVLARRRELRVDEQLDLAQALGEKGVAMRRFLDSWSEALRCWLEDHAGIKLSIEDVEALPGKLPRMREHNTPEIFAEAVRGIFMSLENARLRETIQTKWKGLTDTDSPHAWSCTRRTPITLVANAPFVEAMLRVFNSQANLSDEELKATELMMDTDRAVFETLNDQSACDECFIDGICPEFKPMFNLQIQKATLSDLKAHLEATFGNTPLEWTADIQSFNREVDNWIKHTYARVIFPRFKSKIAELKDDKAKRILLNISSDPRVGTVLIREYRKTEPSGGSL